MKFDFEKLAESFRVGGQFLSDDERLVLSAAIETVLLEKQAGRLPSDLDEDEIVLVSAAVADAFLKE